MSKKFLKVSQISSLPKKPGVYFFYSKDKNPIYIGKSFNLRERVKNHFQQPNYKDNIFIDKIKKIGYISLNSEIEALIEEARLIKKYQPKFNVMFKDDKNYFYVGITRENWPRIFITHQPQKIRNSKHKILNKFQIPNSKSQKKVSDFGFRISDLTYVGPFVGGTALKQTLNILRKIFPYRTCRILPNRPCLWHELNRCPAPCLLEKEIKNKPEFFRQFRERKKDYEENIKKLKLVLREGRKKLILELEKEMKKKAGLQEFEKAAKILDKIKSLKEIFSHHFLFYPQEQLKEEDLGRILEKSLSLPKIPKRIEGYDISQISGEDMVGSMVVFKLSRIFANEDANLCEYNKGLHRKTSTFRCSKYIPDKANYRRFKIKTVRKQNDTACLKEILKRRFRHPEWRFPDLIYIDGGKGQLNAAKSVVDSQKIEIPVIALAKKKNILYNSNSKSYLVLAPSPLAKGEGLDKLPIQVKMLILSLRDESHRFAVFYHHTLRSHRKLRSC